MVMAGPIRPLFDGFSVASINIVFDKGSTGKISNTGSEDTRVFLKDVVQPLASLLARHVQIMHVD